VTAVIIKVFHRLDDREDLVRTIRVETKSAKPLTARRALRIMKAKFPDLRSNPVVMKSELGWYVSRTVKPKSNCGYHYTWEYIYVREDM
jgi:hypothetical protein